jgi:hypothetical protein
VAVSVAILPADGTAAAGSSKAFSAFATDAWGNTFNVTSATTFYIQKGAGGSWTANKYTKSYSPEVPGTWTVYADYGSLPEATTTLTVTHGVAVSIAISPRNPSVLAGGTKNFCAVATDAWSNTFNVTKSTDFSITAGAGGSWSLNKYDTTYTSSAKGVWTVTATYGSLTDGVKLTVK